jgi:dipeptidyl-peptidase-4
MGGNTRWIKLPLSPGNDYIPRFGWVDAHTLWIETLLRDHKHMTIYFADIRTGAARIALAMTDDKFFDESYDVRFLQESPEFLLTSWADGHTHIYRYKYSAANPMSAEATLENEVEKGDYEAEDILGVNEAAQKILYASNEGDPRQHQIWQVNYDGTGKRQLSQSHGFHQATVAPGGVNFVDEASDTTTPPTMSMCSTAGLCSVYWHAAPVTGHVVRAPEDLVLKAADGTTTLYGTLLLPAGATSAASVPMINNPYGGPHAQTVDYRYGAALFLDNVMADAGFAVLHVDNRGMGSRGRDFAQAAYRNFGPVQFSDQMAAIDQVLASHPQIDPKRLGWQGWSWGGTFTLYAMTHSNRFRAGVEGGPVTDWRNYDSIYTERYMGLPSENADIYKTFSVNNFAADLKGHVMMVHGTYDDNVHLENTMQFIHELVEHDVPYDLRLYPGVTHSLGGYVEHLHYYQAMMQHFATYLK